MLPLENYLFSATGPKPNQDTIPAGVTLAGDFGFCFQCQVGSSLVLHRPIEITRITGQIERYFKCPVRAASSTGRRNTMQCIDSTMLARENHLFDCTRLKPSQSSAPAGLTLASDFGICFQCQAGSSLVLRRPIEITALIVHVVF